MTTDAADQCHARCGKSDARPAASGLRRPHRRAHRARLLLVDLQRDYLDRPGLVPHEPTLLAEVATLLDGLPRGGRARRPRPHHRPRRRQRRHAALARDPEPLPCVDGTPGARAAARARSSCPGELVARKQHYRGFADPRSRPLAARARRDPRGHRRHLHARLRARDGPRRLRARLRGGRSRRTRWQRRPGARRRDLPVARRAGPRPSAAPRRSSAPAARPAPPTPASGQLSPVADAEGAQQLPTREECRLGGGLRGRRRCRPAAAAAAAELPAAQLPWRSGRLGSAVRAGLLDAWADVLRARGRRARGDHRRRGRASRGRPPATRCAGRSGTCARPRPLPAKGSRPTSSSPTGSGCGTCRSASSGILMPWNNPLALPCGKIAPALALGNAVVFKPAPEGARTAAAADAHAGRGRHCPTGLVTLVNGDARTGAGDRPRAARRRDRRHRIDRHRPGHRRRLRRTGHPAAGRARRQQRRDRAGRRRPRRRRAGPRPQRLRLRRPAMHGDPAVRRRRPRSSTSSPDGPSHGDRAASGRRCRGRGHRCRPAHLDGRTRPRGRRGRPTPSPTGPCCSRAGAIPDGLEHGAWYAPTLLRADDRAAAIVQVETFGPVAVIQSGDGSRRGDRRWPTASSRAC